VRARHCENFAVEKFVLGLCERRLYCEVFIKRVDFLGRNLLH